MIAAPNRVASPRRRQAHRGRAATVPAPQPYNPAPQQPAANPFASDTTNAATNQVDDLLDLFGDFAPKQPQQQAAMQSPQDFGFFPSGSTANGSSGNMANGHTGALAEEKEESPDQHKHKKKKKHKHKSKDDHHQSSSPKQPQTRTARAQTVSTTVGAPTKPAPNPPKKKIKSIDVLPLLHKGIRMNKFKMNGNKAKVRLFFLSEDNRHFCWSPNIDGNHKSGFEISNLIKSNEERTILLSTMREVKRNSASQLQRLDFIRSKNLTLTITYTSRGSTKQLNVMAYTTFHHALMYEGLQKLMHMAHDRHRDITSVFELYLDFPKEILPKHLQPQRFKWEALKDGEAAKDGDGGGDARDRVKSF